MHFVFALVIWILALIAAWPYVQQTKHPDMKPLVGYLVFVSLFSLVAGMLYSLSTFALSVTVGLQALQDPVNALTFLVIVFVPPFLIARWLIKRPPRQPPPLD